MRSVAVAVLLIALAAPTKILPRTATGLLTTIQASGQSSRAFSSQAGAQASPDAINVLRRQGMDAFHLGDYEGALRIFRQVIAADPSDIVAYNVSANCSIRLADYPSAIDSFQHALQLRPDEWHNLAGLMRAYTLAGMTPDRDALRKHIGELEREGKLPPEFNYVFETFQVEGKKLEVAEFPQIHGFYGRTVSLQAFQQCGQTGLLCNSRVRFGRAAEVGQAAPRGSRGGCQTLFLRWICSRLALDLQLL